MLMPHHQPDLCVERDRFPLSPRVRSFEAILLRIPGEVARDSGMISPTISDLISLSVLR
jgi:hypothetical protein